MGQDLWVKIFLVNVTPRDFTFTCPLINSFLSPNTEKIRCPWYLVISWLCKHFAWQELKLRLGRHLLKSRWRWRWCYLVCRRFEYLLWNLEDRWRWMFVRVSIWINFNTTILRIHRRVQGTSPLFFTKHDVVFSADSHTMDSSEYSVETLVSSKSEDLVLVEVSLSKMLFSSSAFNSEQSGISRATDFCVDTSTSSLEVELEYLVLRSIYVNFTYKQLIQK